MKVKISYKRSNLRAQAICGALIKDISKTDTIVDDISASEVVFCYGASPTHISWYNQYKHQKRFIFIDLGYWKRGSNRSLNASYKMSLDYWHPQSWMDKLDMNNDRFSRSGLRVRNQALGDNILLAGLGKKGSGLYGYEHQSWEKKVVKEIRKYTDRPIVYRPKPSDRLAQPIVGTIYRNDLRRLIDPELDDTFAVVTHHSNVSVDALLRGIPFYNWDGASAGHSMANLSKIEDGRVDLPDRNKFFNNLSYFNWNSNDINRGHTWGFYKELINAQKFDATNGMVRKELRTEGV